MNLFILTLVPKCFRLTKVLFLMEFNGQKNMIHLLEPLQGPLGDPTLFSVQHKPSHLEMFYIFWQHVAPLSVHQMASQFLVYPPPRQRFTAACAGWRSTTEPPCCPNRSPWPERWGRWAAHTCRANTKSNPHTPQLRITGGGRHDTVANLNIY